MLREHYGIRLEDFQEFAVLLEKRFGSSTKVDRARDALKDIRQGQAEIMWAYSIQFEALLGKLHSLTRIEQKPNSFEICIHGWPNWPPLQGL